MKRKTSFGSIESLVERGGEIVSELIYFEKEGRGHTHPLWEVCYILDGTGAIMVGEEKILVAKGDVCKIPPNMNHWMIPEKSLEILIVYTANA